MEAQLSADSLAGHRDASAAGMWDGVAALLNAAFVNPRTAWSKIDAFKRKHGLTALNVALQSGNRHRFGREPGGLSSGNYFTDEGKQLRENALNARRALPQVIQAYYDAEDDQS